MTVSEGEGMRTLTVRTRPVWVGILGVGALAVLSGSAASHWNLIALGLAGFLLLGFLVAFSRNELSFDPNRREVINRTWLGQITWASRYPFDAIKLVVIGDPTYKYRMNESAYTRATTPGNVPRYTLEFERGKGHRNVQLLSQVPLPDLVREAHALAEIAGKQVYVPSHLEQAVAALQGQA